MIDGHEVNFIHIGTVDGKILTFEVTRTVINFAGITLTGCALVLA
jgi:hypothetical protein